MPPQGPKDKISVVPWTQTQPLSQMCATSQPMYKRHGACVMLVQLCFSNLFPSFACDVLVFIELEIGKRQFGMSSTVSSSLYHSIVSVFPHFHSTPNKEMKKGFFLWGCFNSNYHWRKSYLGEMLEESSSSWRNWEKLSTQRLCPQLGEGF